MREKNIFADYSADLSVFLEWLADRNVQEVPRTPDVKSLKTCKLSLSGVGKNIKIEKTADPLCYTLPVSRK